MPVPDFQAFMTPLLEFAGDEKEHSLAETAEALADYFELSAEDRRKLLPSGRQTILLNRVSWSRTYLGKAGLLENPRRGYFRITPLGLETLRRGDIVNKKYLTRFDKFVEFQTTNNTSVDGIKDEQIVSEDVNPEERLERDYQILRASVETDLISTIMVSSPAFFERLVVELLVRMGYGGSLHDAGQAIGQTNDEGIDGVIKEDRLGLDVLYIQAKRWEKIVGRPEIQQFAGALQGKRANKGVFITTSSFSKQARDFVNNINSKIVLLDGQEIARLMFDLNLGVSTEAIYEIKNINQDYFTEE